MPSDSNKTRIVTPATGRLLFEFDGIYSIGQVRKAPMSNVPTVFQYSSIPVDVTGDEVDYNGMSHDRCTVRLALVFFLWVYRKTPGMRVVSIMVSTHK